MFAGRDTEGLGSVGLDDGARKWEGRQSTGGMAIKETATRYDFDDGIVCHSNSSRSRSCLHDVCLHVPGC